MTDSHLTLVDGVANSVIPASDRGLAYGDGVFETIRVRSGGAVLLDAHLARLLRGCERLGIPCHELEAALVADISLLEIAQLEDAVLKLIVTRGSGGRGYAPDLAPQPRRIVSTMAYKPDADAWNRGIRVGICETRLASNPALAGIKHLNRLEQVLASRELHDVDEGLMLDPDGFVVEGTRSNLFVASVGVLLTPPVDRAGVAGVMRDLLIDKAGAEVRALGVDALLSADEVFVCNSVFGIYPVTALAGRAFEVGPLTRAAQSLIGMEFGFE